MKIVFYLGHPAHFHLFKNTISQLQNAGHDIRILIKTKDILESLLQNAGLKYVNILPEGRKDNKIHIALGVLKRDWRLALYCIKEKPDLLVGTSVENSHIGKLFGIPAINVNEDDADVVPLYSKLSYPGASVILSPDSCRNGKWENKTIHYPGYHELAYLHPIHFKPSKKIVEQYFIPDKKFFLIRFAKLTAHHDKGIRGISKNMAQKLISLLEPHGRVFITSERPLDRDLEKYRMAINPLHIHHVMAFADLYIGDSQTMAAEAGVLGTPFIRYNDFVDRIGYLDELEKKYNLGFGISPDNENKLYEIVEQLISTPDLAKVFSERREKMLSEKINVADFFSWFISQYPKSACIVKENNSKFKANKFSLAQHDFKNVGE